MLTELFQFIKRNFQRSNNGAIQLIIIHAFVFIILVISKAICVLLGYESYYQGIYQYLVLPANWNAFLHQPWSIFTYFWIQQEFFSIIWNSFFLYAFGQLIVSLWHSRFLKRIYIFGGIVAGILFLLVYNLVPNLQNYAIHLVGPSGNLYAIMVAAAVILPDFYFNLLFLGNIKVRYIAAILLLLACFEVGSHQTIGLAHLAGGLAGYIYAKFLSKFFEPNSILSYFSNISRRKRKIKVTYQRSAKTGPVVSLKSGNQGQIDIDAILDKIATQGYESLTDKEKQQLFRAGK